MLLKPKPKCRSLQKGGNFFNVEVINMNELVNCLTFLHFAESLVSQFHKVIS